MSVNVSENIERMRKDEKVWKYQICETISLIQYSHPQLYLVESDKKSKNSDL